MNAKEAKLQLKKWDVCSEGLARIRGTRTIAGMISRASLQDLEWAIFKSGLQAEYDKVLGPAWAEYYKVLGPAWAEYYKVLGPAWAEYYKVLGPAWAEYDKVLGPAWAEYDKVCDQAGAEYDKVRADAARKMLTEKYC